MRCIVQRGSNTISIWTWNGRKAGEFLLVVGFEHLAHSTSRSGHGHGNLKIVNAVVLCNLAGIYKSKIDDVNRDFRIIHCLQLIPHQSVAEFHWCFCGRLRKTQSIGIFRVNAHKLAIAGGQRGSRPELLRNDYCRSRGKGVNIATRKLW